MYSNISQILLLYKTWGFHNKFDSTKSLGVYYWCVKIPQCRYMEHGLKYFTSYVQKHIAPLAMCYHPPLVRDKPLGAPASVKLGSCVSTVFFMNNLLASRVIVLCSLIVRFMGANMGPTCVLSAPDGPHVGPMNHAIWVVFRTSRFTHILQDYFTDIEQAWRIR